MAIIEDWRIDGPHGIEFSNVFQEKIMVLLLLEARGALLLLVFIVWWTMFSGRQKGELKGKSVPGEDDAKEEDKK